MSHAADFEVRVRREQHDGLEGDAREEPSAEGGHHGVDGLEGVVALQRSAGNRAVAHVIGTGIQREPQHAGKPPDPQTQIEALKKRQDALSARQASTDQDLRWRATFGEHLSSWRQAILRVSGGLEAAQNGFTQAQQDQAKFDALVTQLFIAAVSIGFAAGFEPLLVGQLGQGKVDDALKEVEQKVEAWENPAVQAAGSTSNIVPASQQVAGAGGGQPPAAPAVPAGSPMTYLTSNLETLEHHNQAIEHAFGERANKRLSASDDEMLAFKPDPQEKIYADLEAKLSAASQGVENMKAPAEVARVFERHIWAAWIKQHAELQISMEHAPVHEPVTESPAEREKKKAGQPGLPEHYDVDLGSYVEDRLNALGIGSAAGVTLTGHWYSPNTPLRDWPRMLISWAFSYNETIGTSS